MTRANRSFSPGSGDRDRGVGAERGSVLVVVMITLIFATVALVAFIDKASNDLLVEHRDSVTRRLRVEAYSALEVTLAVLQDFQRANNGLRSPAEGWGDPLGFAGYTPTNDRTVDIAFEDESGKISLPRANMTTLTNLFKNWQIPQNDAEELADALMGWMTANHVYANLQTDYEQGDLPFEEPRRPLRSFMELQAIDKVREMFFENGRPNDFWRRFTESVSLFNFRQSNLNGGRGDTLAALGQFDETQQTNLSEYIQGTGAYLNQGPGFFQNVGEAQRILGPGDARAFNVTISALRIFVTVHEGQTVFRLTAVVAPAGGATTVQTNATERKTEAASATRNETPTRNQPNANTPAAPQPRGTNTAASASTRNLQYPFTLLEIRENDEMPVPPPPSTVEPPI
jgi:general secretion pathway protein K